MSKAQLKKALRNRSSAQSERRAEITKHVDHQIELAKWRETPTVELPDDLPAPLPKKITFEGPFGNAERTLAKMSAVSALRILPATGKMTVEQLYYRLCDLYEDDFVEEIAQEVIRLGPVTDDEISQAVFSYLTLAKGKLRG